ncbi:MAG: T9SS type A sorting domain-containing protein [Bacteroidia bacterium]
MRIVSILLLFAVFSAHAQFDGAGGELGSRSIHKDHEAISEWAASAEIERGYMQVNDTALGKPSVGTVNSALGPVDGDVLSLGDGGVVVLTFDDPIVNRSGYDFAVFENGFKVGLSYYLELAHVEVSKNGVDYTRFPSESLVDTSFQTNNFSYTDPRLLYNLAGKHQAPYGSLFDLDEIGLDTINYVRLIDVVGSVNDSFGSRDSKGRLINDPWPSPFESSGFDLDAVGIVNGAILKREEHVLSNVKIYPTRTRSNASINVDAPEGSDTRVFDMHGKEVLVATSNRFRISTAGVYVVQVSNGTRLYTQKVILY